jgi:hypothetical protein
MGPLWRQGRSGGAAFGRWGRAVLVCSYNGEGGTRGDGRSAEGDPWALADPHACTLDGRALHAQGTSSGRSAAYRVVLVYVRQSKHG